MLKNSRFFTALVWVCVTACSYSNVVEQPTVKPTFPPTQTIASTRTPQPTVTITPTPTATAIPTVTPTPSKEPTPTPTPCVPASNPSALSCGQLASILNSGYSFLYSSESKEIANIYSLNHFETTSFSGMTWKFASGFIVSVDQPNNALYPQEGRNLIFGDSYFRYFKVRFFDRNGEPHDYWLQLWATKERPWVSIIRWDKPIADNETERPDANDILAAGANSDGSKERDHIDEIFDILKVNKQFIAQITISDSGNHDALNGMDKPEYLQVLQQFSDAIEGKGEFPKPPEGFYLPSEGIIVPFNK